MRRQFLGVGTEAHDCEFIAEGLAPVSECSLGDAGSGGQLFFIHCFHITLKLIFLTLRLMKISLRLMDLSLRLMGGMGELRNR